MRNIPIFLMLTFVAQLSGGANAQSRGKKTARLPASVRAMMPRGALSLRLFRLAPAPHATAYLVHLWMLPRRNPRAESQHPFDFYEDQISRANGSFADSIAISPLVFDIFIDGRTPKYRASVIHSSDVIPENVALRYWNSKDKFGLILQVDEQRGGLGRHTFVFLDSDFGEFPSRGTLNSSGGYGGGTNYSYRRDTNGLLEVVKHRAC